MAEVAARRARSRNEPQAVRSARFSPNYLWENADISRGAPRPCGRIGAVEGNHVAFGEGDAVPEMS